MMHEVRYDKLWIVSPSDKDKDPNMTVNHGKTRAEVLNYLKQRSAALGENLEKSFKEIKVVRNLGLSGIFINIDGDEARVKSIIESAKNKYNCDIADGETPMYL